MTPKAEHLAGRTEEADWIGYRERGSNVLLRIMA